ncbi:hypothetical protein MKW98_016499 [Papaver atlanticum]|uniref:F-box domain-containing protein n=1 Tax=Papaver atlanticum TaxID=357466 RepID=A0AAD4T6T1_9MAGN|nr:hypothetical protein MKW98_016499 [Papaver atlanticum]
MQGKSKSLCCSKYHEEEEEIDRISRLPDNLIHEILSFNHMKLAVQTCVLSKRWKNIWMSLPYITLALNSFLEDERYNPRDTMDRFVGFVDNVLEFRDDDSDIQNFNLGSVICDYASVETHNRWIIASVNRNVRNLAIVVAYSLNSPYQFPQQLLNCKTLKSMAIILGGRQFGDRCAHVILPRSMSLPQIEVLSLYGISISNVDLQRVFSSCPLMKKVTIQESDIQTDNQRNVIIEFHSLEAFKLIDNRHTHLGSSDHSLTYTTKISAPNVKSFTFAGSMTEDLSLENLSSLVDAHLDLRLRKEEADEIAETYFELPAEEMFAKRTMKFLRAVQKVQHLILSSGFLEVLLQASGALYHQPPQLCNLETLQLEIRFTRGCLRSIAYLLKISPVIMTLILVSEEANLPDVGNDWDAGLSSTCMFSHLKFVEISEVEGCDNELKFLRVSEDHFQYLNSGLIRVAKSNFGVASDPIAAEAKSMVEYLGSKPPAYRSSFCQRVAYCNGFAYVKPVTQFAGIKGLITVTTTSTGGQYLCDGFGFDSKVIVIFTTTASTIAKIATSNSQ